MKPKQTSETEKADIVERLRDYTTARISGPNDTVLVVGVLNVTQRVPVSFLNEAATEIERLRAELQARRAAEAKAVEALPPGRSKQDVANLVDAAIQDSLVELDDLGGHRYDYDIMQEKLRANGLTIATLGARDD